MQFDKELQLIYITEVTKKDILGGLDTITEKFYGYIIQEGIYGIPLKKSAIEIAEQLDELIGLGEFDKKILINTLLKEKRLHTTFNPVANLLIEVSISKNKEDILKELNGRIHTLNEIRADISNG